MEDASVSTGKNGARDEQRCYERTGEDTKQAEDCVVRSICAITMKLVRANAERKEEKAIDRKG